jgi:hypothetical protein
MTTLLCSPLDHRRTVQKRSGGKRLWDLNYLQNLFMEMIQVPIRKTASTSRRSTTDYSVEAHFYLGMWNSTLVNKWRWFRARVSDRLDVVVQRQIQNMTPRTRTYTGTQLHAPRSKFPSFITIRTRLLCRFTTLHVLFNESDKICGRLHYVPVLIKRNGNRKRNTRYPNTRDMFTLSTLQDDARRPPLTSCAQKWMWGECMMVRGLNLFFERSTAAAQGGLCTQHCL